jgi:tRNA (guanine-N7-)-methyltransferase
LTPARPPDTAFVPSPLHGRRKAKKLRTHHTALVDNMLPHLALDLSKPLGDPAALFPHRPESFWMEIGFGGGEHMIQEALRHPDVGVFGCEPFVNGVAKALALIAEADLCNIRLYNGDAGDVIDAMPDATLSCVYLLYPDPWPKRRQHKRRFLSDDMLARLARVMRSGAELRFATDIDHNAGWVLARILRAPDFVWPAQSAADWHVPWPDWESTRYESKALSEGRQPAYFTFLRK